MARLSNSDLAKIPGFVFRESDKEEVPSLEKMQAVARNCYLIIAGNTIWLLLPLLGFLTSNQLMVIFQGLIVGCAVLFAKVPIWTGSSRTRRSRRASGTLRMHWAWVSELCDR